MAAREVNVLLLGETGVGKTTFINALANYLHYGSLQDAMKNRLIVLAPTLISLVNDENDTIAIPVGATGHQQRVGEAGTLTVSSYHIPLGGGSLRLIDSPGIGDPRGVEQDMINIENILRHLSSLRELHAICFLLKPNTSRNNVLFDYSLKQLLTRLQVSSSANLVFVFTNTRSTFYTAGDTRQCLEKLFEDIKSRPPHVSIPFNDSNIFCVDNESFKHLAAFSHFQQLDKVAMDSSVESWNVSAGECRRLISYIMGLRPHPMSITIDINEARNLIDRHIQPLADVSQLIDENIALLQKQENELHKDYHDLGELKDKLISRQVVIQETKLDKPVTICKNNKCSHKEKVEGCEQWIYSSFILLINSIFNFIFNNYILNNYIFNNSIANKFRSCKSFLKFTFSYFEKKCPKCSCRLTHHETTTNVETEKCEGYLEKDGIDKICDRTILLREKKETIAKISGLIKDHKSEKDDIVKSIAKFVHFLQANSICPFIDFFEENMQEMIMKERNLGKKMDAVRINNLSQMLEVYKQAKASFRRYKKGVAQFTAITTDDIRKTLTRLHDLKLNGKKIRELFENQKIGQNLNNFVITEKKTSAQSPKLKNIKTNKIIPPSQSFNAYGQGNFQEIASTGFENLRCQADISMDKNFYQNPHHKVPFRGMPPIAKWQFTQGFIPYNNYGFQANPMVPGPFLGNPAQYDMIHNQQQEIKNKIWK